MSKKIAAAAAFAAALSGATILGAAPAAAMSDGETAAIGLGAFAVGAVASGAMSGGYHQHEVVYRDCYSARRPVYNHWGDVVGFRRVRYCD
ncbi:MAG: hypothetical protein ACR652_04215 [Methylocystis sp.]|uniref:hypothetical protein n=1 Tax=Methylocystis sp. TaxID=1911079 RepID=UPI003DA5994B